MGFREWWKKLDYWKNGIFIGIVIGLLKVPFFAIFGMYVPELIIKFFEVPDKQICNLLGIGEGEPCGFFFLYYGALYNPIFYATIGALIGFLISKLREK